MFTCDMSYNDLKDFQFNLNSVIVSNELYYCYHKKQQNLALCIRDHLLKTIFEI